MLQTVAIGVSMLLKSTTEQDQQHSASRRHCSSNCERSAKCLPAILVLEHGRRHFNFQNRLQSDNPGSLITHSSEGQAGSCLTYWASVSCDHPIITLKNASNIRRTVRPPRKFNLHAERALMSWSQLLPASNLKT